MFRILFPMNFLYRDALATDGGGIEAVTKAVGELKTAAEKGQEAVKKQLEGVGEEVKTIQTSVTDVKTVVDTVKQGHEQLKDEVKSLKAARGRQADGPEYKSFNHNLNQLITDNAEAIKGFKSGADLRFTLKAVGDMSYTANFGGDSATVLTTEYKRNPLDLLQETTWIRDILPQGTTQAASIWYPRYIGGEGGAAIWNNGTGAGGANESKSKMDFDFDSKNDIVRWIAGIVRVPREMLDDVEFLSSFLQQNMLISLFHAENGQLLRGLGDAQKQLTGLFTVSEDYDGAFTIPVERIIDAAYGQIVTNTKGALKPNFAILHPRDAVSIALNKATTSGLYNLPLGSVGYVDGRLTIGGLRVVTTTDVDRGEFLVGASQAAQMITRLQPEIRMFEQNNDDVEKNMVTFRIEERITLATYYPQGFVNGTLEPTT